MRNHMIAAMLLAMIGGASISAYAEPTLTELQQQATAGDAIPVINEDA